MKKLLLVLSLSTLLSCGIEKDNNEGNRLVISGDKYFVYYDSEVIEIPKNTYITTDKKIEDYFNNIILIGKTMKNEKELLLDLSKYFPHGIHNVRKGENPTAFTPLPTMTVKDKSIVDSISLSLVLAGDSAEALINVNNTSEILEVKDSSLVDPEISLEGKTVEILNANGITGFASNLGKAFETNLKMKYNAENYKELSNMSYIVNHKLTEAELNKFVNSLSLKYIKIKKDDNLKANSDVVLITGNDNKVDYTINILTNNQTSELKELLNGYKTEIKKTETEIKEIIIKHSSEDVIIAKKLLSYIPEAKLELDENQKTITILSNR